MNGSLGAHRAYVSFGDCLKKMFKEGLLSYYRGFWISLIRIIPAASIQFACFDYLKELSTWFVINVYYVSNIVFIITREFSAFKLEITITITVTLVSCFIYPSAASSNLINSSSLIGLVILPYLAHWHNYNSMVSAFSCFTNLMFATFDIWM
jgi:hypothetical protein